jgi:hypothetical protein
MKYKVPDVELVIFLGDEAPEGKAYSLDMVDVVLKTVGSCALVISFGIAITVLGV